MVVGDLFCSPSHPPSSIVLETSRDISWISELSISSSAQSRRCRILSLGDLVLLQAGSRSRGRLPVFETPLGKHKLDRTLPSFLEEALHDPSRLIRRIK